MSQPQYVSLDFDRTIWDTDNNKPYDFAWDFIDALRTRGLKILIHSCNHASWIRKMCEEHNLRPDMIWGEDGNVGCGKPLVVAAVDDRAVAFRGDWRAALADVLELVETKPVKHYRGPVYLGNQHRPANNE